MVLFDIIYEKLALGFRALQTKQHQKHDFDDLFRVFDLQTQFLSPFDYPFILYLLSPTVNTADDHLFDLSDFWKFLLF